MYESVYEALGLNENNALEDKKYAIKSYQNLLNDHLFKFGKCKIELDDSGSILRFWRNESQEGAPDFELPVAGVELPYILKTLTEEVVTRYF